MFTRRITDAFFAVTLSDEQLYLLSQVYTCAIAHIEGEYPNEMSEDDIDNLLTMFNEQVTRNMRGAGWWTRFNDDEMSATKMALNIALSIAKGDADEAPEVSDDEADLIEKMLSIITSQQNRSESRYTHRNNNRRPRYANQG